MLEIADEFEGLDNIVNRSTEKSQMLMVREVVQLAQELNNAHRLGGSNVDWEVLANRLSIMAEQAKSLSQGIGVPSDDFISYIADYDFGIDKAASEEKSNAKPISM